LSLDSDYLPFSWSGSFLCAVVGFLSKATSPHGSRFVNSQIRMPHTSSESRQGEWAPQVAPAP
jgi:hypothetical protein